MGAYLMILEWQRPENLTHDYVPPIVQQGHVTAEWFWDSAVRNARLRGDPPDLIAHAERMLEASRD